MRILIAGGTGFIGRAILPRLQREGHAVTLLTRSVASAGRIPAGIEPVFWDPKSPDPPALPGNLDAVIHMGGAAIAPRPWTQSRKQILWQSRVGSTHKLVEALGRLPNKPGALVCASGMGYYGDTGDRPVSPGDAPGGDFLGRMAQAWEQEAFAAQSLGMRVAVLRLGLVLGRNGGALPRLALPFRFGLGAVLGSGRQYWPWIHVEDAAELFCRACIGDAFSGILHAVSGEPVTQNTFAKTLAEALRRPLWLRVPEPLLRMALGEMADLFLHGQKASGNAPEFQPRYPSLPEALQTLF
jgi:uncharacterized protein (TIGR01777 family)